MLPLNCANALEKAPISSASPRAARIGLRLIPTSKKVYGAVSSMRVSCLRQRNNQRENAFSAGQISSLASSRKTIFPLKHGMQWVRCTNGPAGQQVAFIGHAGQCKVRLFRGRVARMAKQPGHSDGPGVLERPEKRRALVQSKSVGYSCTMIRSSREPSLILAGITD